MAVRQALTIFAVADLERATGFYRDLLGWPVRVAVPVFVQLAAPDGAPDLGLYLREGFAANLGKTAADLTAGPLTTAELYLYPDDLEAAMRRAEAAGARKLSDLAPRTWGDLAAYFADPDGNIVALARPAHDDDAEEPHAE